MADYTLLIVAGIVTFFLAVGLSRLWTRWRSRSSARQLDAELEELLSSFDTDDKDR